MVESKDETKSSEGSGMEVYQAEQLDTLLNLSAKMLNKNCDTQKTDAFTTLKRDIDPHCLLIIKALRQKL